MSQGVVAGPAIVESIQAPAVRAINELDQQIVTADDDVDGKLWEQARLVVAQLEAGWSQRQLAKQWINARTGEPHSVAHVHYTARAYRVQFTEQPRPSFRDAYNALSNTSKRLAQNTGCFEWYTPAEVIEASRAVLGDIDLDPASCEQANKVVQAARFYTRDEDGLTQPWYGRIWMNPPYAQPLVQQFADKLAASVTAGDVPAAIVLVNNATDTEFFHTLAAVSSAFCFPKGRLRFWQPDTDPDDAAGALQGQVVIYVGPNTGRFAQAFRPFGVVLVTT
jgi:phage N-6-adenine-methyltransferase